MQSRSVINDWFIVFTDDRASLFSYVAFLMSYGSKYRASLCDCPLVTTEVKWSCCALRCYFIQSSQWTERTGVKALGEVKDTEGHVVTQSWRTGSVKLCGSHLFVFWSKEENIAGLICTAFSPAPSERPCLRVLFHRACAMPVGSLLLPPHPLHLRQKIFSSTEHNSVFHSRMAILRAPNLQCSSVPK